jgi:hypothetical protein
MPFVPLVVKKPGIALECVSSEAVKKLKLPQVVHFVPFPRLGEYDNSPGFQPGENEKKRRVPVGPHDRLIKGNREDCAFSGWSCGPTA